MRKPFLKKLLSHFSDVLIEQSSSIHNPVLQVLLSQGRYQLCTEDAIYSFDDKYENFRYTFEKIDVKRKPYENVLLLGLGLGSIPYMLEKTFQVETAFTAVEIDPEICRLAEKYVLGDLKSNIEVYPIDAMNYFEWYDHSFDMIAMDIFQSAEIPEAFQSKEYLQVLKSRLNDNGVLLYNRLADSAENKMECKTFFDTWLSVFPEGTYVETDLNNIFVNHKSFVKK